MSDTSPIDWPIVQVGDQRLTVRWTFYAQWLLSKRKVRVSELPRLMKEVDPAIVDVMVECFAAAVSENFTKRGQVAPDAEYWAATISENGGDEKFKELNAAIWAAVGKAPRSVPPVPAEKTVELTN